MSSKELDMNENGATSTAPIASDPWAMIGVWLTVGLLVLLSVSTVVLASQNRSLEQELNARLDAAFQRLDTNDFRLDELDQRVYAIQHDETPKHTYRNTP